MKMKVFFNLALLVIVGGCSSFKEKVGLTYYAPNEFETTQNEPLEIPPVLRLENPNEGEYKRKTSAADKAKSLLVSSSTKSTASDHQAEKLLLQKIGSDQRDSNIRRTLDRDNSQEPTLNEKIQRTLAFWKKPQKGKVIDPHKEQEQLMSPEDEEK